jgi:phosphoribosylanthranilate isomerase
MRHPDNILRVAALQVNWMGFIFWPKSKRWLKPEERKQVMEKIKDAPFRKVGVFVNALAGEMIDTAEECRLDYLQLHGDESPELCHTLRKQGFRVIKAFAVATPEDLEQTAAYEGRADYFLFDTKCESRGGSGKSFDWSVLKACKGTTPFLLSGGIHPGSLSAIRRFHHPRLAGVDLNSGFETAPGLKDTDKLAAFVRELRAGHA